MQIIELQFTDGFQTQKYSPPDDRTQVYILYSRGEVIRYGLKGIWKFLIFINIQNPYHFGEICLFLSLGQQLFEIQASGFWACLKKKVFLGRIYIICTSYSIHSCQIAFNPVSKTWIPFIYLSCVDNSPHKRLESNQPGMRISNFISDIVYSLIIQNWLEVSLKYRILYWVSSEPWDQTILLPINNKTELLRWSSWHMPGYSSFQYWPIPLTY